jgi:hypothetical protein
MPSMLERGRALDVAMQRLDPEDEDEYNYPVRCDGKRGYLILSQRKLLFVEERGFLSQSYDVILDLPYEHIDEITVHGDTLEFIEAEDGRHTVKSIVPISIIENALRELRDDAVSKVAPIIA